jgi:hypothetical protein
MCATNAYSSCLESNAPTLIGVWVIEPDTWDVTQGNWTTKESFSCIIKTNCHNNIAKHFVLVEKFSGYWIPLTPALSRKGGCRKSRKVGSCPTIKG